MSSAERTVRRAAPVTGGCRRSHQLRCESLREGGGVWGKSRLCKRWHVQGQLFNTMKGAVNRQRVQPMPQGSIRHSMHRVTLGGPNPATWLTCLADQKVSRPANMETVTVSRVSRWTRLRLRLRQHRGGIAGRRGLDATRIYLKSSCYLRLSHTCLLSPFAS